MTSPLVSVLLPVYNAGSYLRPALESIRNQTYSNLEILVIDDGSTDGCMQSIADMKDGRVRMLCQANAGKSVAMNLALSRIQGEFYVIQDADDLSYPTRIERQVACMMEHPEAAAVFTGFDLILDNRHLAPRFRAKDVHECRKDIEGMRMPSHDPTAMWRISMVRDMSYEPSLRVGQGWDYILRAGERHPMVVLGECLYSYRTHAGSNTRQDGARRREKEREVVRRARERRGLPMGGDHPSGWAQDRLTGHRDREHGLVPHFMESVLDQRRAGRWGDSLATAAACITLHPLDPYYYKPLCYHFTPFGMIERYRRWKAAHRQAG